VKFTYHLLLKNTIFFPGKRKEVSNNKHLKKIYGARYYSLRYEIKSIEAKERMKCHHPFSDRECLNKDRAVSPWVCAELCLFFVQEGDLQDEPMEWDGKKSCCSPERTTLS